MTNGRFHPKAWVAFTLQAMYMAAEGLCSIFVAVYLWVNSLDFGVVCQHYFALYLVTPVVFILSGWYSQSHDRLHAYRAGLVLHALYYGLFLMLRERSAEFAMHLGVLLGITQGVYGAGASTFNYDMSKEGSRERYFGYLMPLMGMARLVAPMISGLVITLSPNKLSGYHTIFFIAIFVYALCFLLSFKMPPDSEPRPFRLKRALFPGRDQRDWQLVMLAALSLAGAFSIFAFLLGLVMYMESGNEALVGGYASFQALAGIIASFILGRIVVPRNRKKFMLWGSLLLVAAGALISMKITVFTLFLFGFLRSTAGPMFGIAHFSMRLDIISECAEEDAQRIEYLTAWQVPLALGRVLMLLVLVALYSWPSDSALGLRLAMFILCSTRFLTYFLLARTSMVRRY